MTHRGVARLFQDPARFNPSRDGQVPWRRDPLSLALRIAYMLGRMIFSKHPGDVVTWVRSMRKRSEPLSMALPWLTFDAIRAIDKHLVPDSRLFEFGSGHSTLYWAQRGVRVYSMEDDATWFELARNKLAAYPNAAVSFAADERGYAHGIDHVDGQFDVVLVDGAFRMSCIDTAVPRVRPGGLLVVDNTDWHWFADVDCRVPQTWTKTVFAGCAPFIGYPSQTTVWVRPNA
jgi:hypothetical protein